jgi:hypothetical protein
LIAPSADPTKQLLPHESFPLPVLTEMVKIRFKLQEGFSVEQLTLSEKISMIHSLCESLYSTEKLADVTARKALRALRESELRIEPIGRDSWGAVYFNFCNSDFRICMTQ